MAITQTITAIPTAGHRGVDARETFVTKQEAFQDALTTTTVTQLNTFASQANTLETNVNAKEASAVTAKNNAVLAQVAAETARDEAVGAVSQLPDGIINDATITTLDTWSSSKIDTTKADKSDTYTKSEIDINKQDTLVSGANIMTINGENILGSGDLTTTPVNDITLKALKLIPADGDYRVQSLSQIQVDSDHIMYLYKAYRATPAGYALYGIIYEVSTNTFGNYTLIDSIANAEVNMGIVTKVSDGKVFLYYFKSPYYKGVIITTSGKTIAVGTSAIHASGYLSNMCTVVIGTTVVLCFKNASTILVLVAIDCSGATPSFGTDVSINGGYNSILDLLNLWVENSRVCVAFTSSTSAFTAANYGLSGTTLTAGTPVVLSNVGNDGGAFIEKMVNGDVLFGTSVNGTTYRIYKIVQTGTVTSLEQKFTYTYLYPSYPVAHWCIETDGTDSVIYLWGGTNLLFLMSAKYSSSGVLSGTPQYVLQIPDITPSYAEYISAVVYSDFDTILLIYTEGATGQNYPSLIEMSSNGEILSHNNKMWANYNFNYVIAASQPRIKRWLKTKQHRMFFHNVRELPEFKDYKQNSAFLSTLNSISSLFKITDTLYSDIDGFSIKIFEVTL